MPKVRWRQTLWALAAVVLGWACPVHAGHVLFDVADRQVLDAADADTVIPPGRVADLLLVAVLRERIASGELTLADRVTTLPVAGDRGPHLAPHEPLEIGELLQLLLLSDSRTAAKTLAWAAGPSIGRCLTRMQQLSVRLGLTHTTLPDDWPFGAALTTTNVAGRQGTTTARELGILALLVSTDTELRRRLALDGVPISNGGLIVRATDPLIAMRTEHVPARHDGGADGASIALVERDGFELLAIGVGAHAGKELETTLERGFERYRRLELVHEGQPVGPKVHVRGGIIPRFNAVAAEGWAITTPNVAHSNLALRLQLPTEIDAPVEVHQPLGELVVEQGGRVLTVVPLVAPQAIAPSGWLDTAHRAPRP
jgi:serine-type D-Ala-D-Ala carboxypeptidase (penicillin-binding protein 5/6)